VSTGAFRSPMLGIHLRRDGQPRFSGRARLQWVKTGDFFVATPGPLTVDEGHAALGFGRAGVGIMYGAEPIFRPDIESGALIPVLPGWASPGEGFHIYYSGRHQVPTALRLLTDLIREIRPLGL